MQARSTTAITTIGIVGAGAMGRGIAQIASMANVRVRLFDLRPGAAQEARASVIGQLERLCEKGKLDASAVADAGALIEPAATLDAMADCQAVVEAIVENIDAKRDLFRALEGIVAPDCILATNTSSLSVTAIAAAVARPERVAGFHFFNPVPLMKVVEVIGGVLTADSVTQSLLDLGRRFGHTAVLARDTPGFIVNHAGRGYVTEALRIAQENVAGFAQIDEVLRDAAGFKLGPFQLMDLTGLDVSHPVMESIYQQYYQEPRYRPSVITAQRLEAGLLGRKSQRGFYRYDGEDTAAAESSAVAWDGPVWIDAFDPAVRAKATALLARCGVEPVAQPTAGALCIVTPLGEDVSTCVARRALDPERTIGLDLLIDDPRRVTLMTNPATDTKIALRAKAMFAQASLPATLIDDSAGFIVQRVLATIVNIGCDIVQQGICTPEDLDSAVELGLGYPHGPLTWGDRIGPARVLAVLHNLHRLTGDPRYRPSPWLTRRAQLGLSLRHGKQAF
ncbi:3-hydroxyacyl-CoA dehydrogenase [Noviherbaspirillum denitrificans]|uniref:3-hydroxyacyl-CoA dehydrogenase n=1 Tax=Noviherbaspirillum denitrificans TaxID=1968433 RepID=A0A254TE80_9BURK|nr:3-hydroxyacyl-CoA dehydrogenase [Noviherbaspirillum denitrificans]OWW20956.1 3-hydroxyacyl-CoA dehydrogenase [Noviherbaspirillum denitrificans]